MTLIFLSRIALTLYGLGLLGCFFRLLSLEASSGQHPTWNQLGAVLIWPLLIATRQGRNKLKVALTEAVPAKKDGK